MAAETAAYSPDRIAPLTPWTRHLILLAAIAILLAWLCREDIFGIVGIWQRTGAFHHCVLIPPILVWLVWQRRAVLAQLSPEYALNGVIWVAFGSCIWLAGAAGYVALLRHAGLVIAGQGLVVALLGVPVARALAFPLGFALFLIPAGSEFEPILQLVTARIAVAFLHLAGTSAVLEGVFIATPAGLFRVAEACSGTAFLLAMAAYGMLVASMCFTNLKRRIAFLAAAMTAAVLTNGLRAFGIMELANLTSIRNPAVQDHLLYGWLLFAAVLAGLMVAASRWFDRHPDAPHGDASALQGLGRGERGAAVVVPAVLGALLLPSLWLAATAPADSAVPPPPTAPAIPGWQRAGGTSDWHPHFDGATWIGQWRYRRGSETVDLAVIQFARQSEGHELVGFGQGAVAPVDRWALMADAPAPAGAHSDWLRGPQGQRRYAATFYLVGGTVTGSRIVAKLAAVSARLFGGDHGAVAVILSTPGTDRTAADFLHNGGSAQEMADRALAMR